MDIHSAEAHLEKVNQYLEQVLKNNPTMYTKTREKLKNISNELFKGLQLVSEILAEDSLMIESEFGETDSQVEELLAEMQQNSTNTLSRINQLQQFVYTPSDSSESLKVTYDSNHISGKKRKYAIANYGQTLRNLASAKIPYSVVSDCASMLWRWYDNRFFITPKACPNFHYNIRKIPEWMRDIVIVYGKHVADGDADQFVARFNEWSDSLLQSTHLQQYAIPYEVYQLSHNLTSEDVTIEAVMIWEVLFEFGLESLSSSRLGELGLNSECVYNQCVKYNSTIADRYVYYKEDDSILTGDVGGNN